MKIENKIEMKKDLVLQTPETPAVWTPRINLYEPEASPNEYAKMRKEFAQIRPAGGARLIVADPPWLFQNYSAKGEERNANQHYDCKPTPWMYGIPVDVLTNTKGCLLMMWATNPMLRDAFDVMDAWGFNYCTAGTWVKRTSKTYKLCFGGGYAFRSANEPILLGIKGRVSLESRSQRGVIISEDDDMANVLPIETLGFTVEAIRPTEHSRKPDAFYHAARSLVTEGPAVDLFSRETRPGFVPWGNEVGKFNKQTEEEN